MKKILGLDLGTNSIGWAIREIDVENDNQIIDYGVKVFKKGFGDGKSGEFSLAAERRKNRSKRRLYNAKRYRKWQLIKVLIKNGMCPLSNEELRLWSIGDWKKVNGQWKNLGRKFPVENEVFQHWIAFNPEFFGNKNVSENGMLVRKNPYDIRCELLECEEKNELLKQYKIGRALYHMAQRRGFKSSRKSGQSTYAKNEEIEQKKEINPDFHIAVLAKEKLNIGKRFRASGVIQRKYFEDEFFAICQKQKLDVELTHKLHKAIFFVRPLRSQKGLVGNCTLEKGKTRIPISHPKFEEFRALQFINNIKWRENGQDDFVQIPISLKKKIFEELFFRRLTSGKNKGKVNTDSYFKFEEIIKNFSDNGRFEFNFKNLPNVSTCPIIATLINIFENEWKDIFILDEDALGINWEGLSIKYSVKYGKNTGCLRVLTIDEIWHLLYDFIQIKDANEKLFNFSKQVLNFDENKAKAFSEIDIQNGYGSLSYKAINKILPYLQKGYIYSEAVLFANMKKVLGKDYEKKQEQAKLIIAQAIKGINKEKEILNIVNGLIQNYFTVTDTPFYPKGVENEFLKRCYREDVKKKLIQYYGKNDWNNKSENEKTEIEELVFQMYLKFLNGEQSEDEKSTHEAKLDYYRLPRVDEAIKLTLKEKFNLKEENLKHLYHPSDIEMYPKSITEIKGTSIKLLESPQPPSKGWKNPMAMRTLHELRHLLNYLLSEKKIDEHTKIVVEMARELNDANKRWAIQTYQRAREEENKEFARAIVGVVKPENPSISEHDVENINKVRLWWEQIEENEEKLKAIKSLKEDIEKYRLWKEQGCICMYTGKLISITNLFDGTQTQIMHTFPASISFDNSLANLTVGDAYYNNEIQGNKIPTQLPNYYESIVINGKTYTAIEPRLQKWRLKVKSLKEQIERIKTTGVDSEIKKNAIQKKRLLQLHYEYWKKKLDTFTLEEIPSNWKNSQLVDSQIISKYARAYLKTVFYKVDVQKGSITNTFKKIYQIKGDEQKDRSKHSHHAVDAAVLTLIPGSAKREAILEEYFKAEESYRKFHAKPYQTFASSHVLDIENNIVINHVVHDNTLKETIKNIRKRGKKTGRVAQGDSIRGQLHKESFFGAVKAVARNEQGYTIKEGEKYKILKNKNGDDEIWIVSRKPINEINIEKDIIVDELLKLHIKRQLDNGVALTDVVDFNEKKIRHIRVRVKAGVGFLSKERALPIKEQTYLSKFEHKKYYLAQNEENYLFLLYEGVNEKNKTIRHYRILNLFDIANLKIKSINEIKNETFFKTIEKGGQKLELRNVLKVGDKVIMLCKDKDEINNENIMKRIFHIYKFNEPAKNIAYVYFQNNIEARQDSEIEKGEKLFEPNKYQARLELTVDKLNCLFENEDFLIKQDGTVNMF